MHGTVVVERTSGIERPERVRIVAVELQWVRRRRARLLLRLRRTVDPTPVRNGMRNRSIIYQCQTLPFADRDARLHEIISAHMHRQRTIATATATAAATRAAASSQEGCYETQYNKQQYEFLHGI